MSSPTPYVPRTAAGVIAGPVEDKSRPWLALRPRETKAEWHERTSHSCWRCGRYEPDNAALDAHEAAH
jgi:hypothetical protein